MKSQHEGRELEGGPPGELKYLRSFLARVMTSGCRWRPRQLRAFTSQDG